MIYLTLFLEILKILNVFITRIISMKAEEYALFKERFQTILDSMDKAVNKQQDAFNESAYISNREWEFTKRFNGYKTAILGVLQKGGGYGDLAAVPNGGMGSRIVIIRATVIDILTRPTTLDDKSALIAKALVEIKA